MAPRHTATPAPADTGHGRRDADQPGGEITPTIADPTHQPQPAELPQVREARERDTAARARLRSGRPEPEPGEPERTRRRLPGRWS